MLMTPPPAHLIAAAALLGLCALAYMSGHKNGKAQAQAQHAASVIEQQGAALTAWQQAAAEHAALIEASAAASAQVRATADAMAQSNRTTTHELQTLLATTAADRAGCLLDAGIVRQLSSAHNRATDAAAGTPASGPDERLPTPARAARPAR